MNFSFIQQASLTGADFNSQTRFVIDDFLPERMITLIYADGGNGKSWLSLSLSKRCAELGKQVIYLDFDNPLSVLKQRRVFENLINPYSQVHYVQRSKSNYSPIELLRQLEQQATADSLCNSVIILDSLRNFANVDNGNAMNDLLVLCTNLREAGSTLVILHHSNKDGKNYQGSNHIRNAVDNMYQLKRIIQQDSHLTVHCRVVKERANITDHAFVIDSATLEYRCVDADSVLVGEEEERFVSSARAALCKESLCQTRLLEACGRDKTNKLGRRWLDKYTDQHWRRLKQGGVWMYQIADNNLDNPDNSWLQQMNKELSGLSE